MLDIRWTEGPEELESLAVSLRAVLAAQGAERPYDELVSVLGLGALIAAVPGECVDRWCLYARDVALAETAELLGLRLRGLHPSEAAAGLEHAAGFAQHFHDSYAPLMRAALQCQQALLVWGGWPEPAERGWGVVVQADDERLLGRTVGDGGRMIALAGPAWQVYVVEDYRPPEPGRCTPAALLAHSARLACAAWAGKLPTGTRVETGRRAYEAWRQVALQAKPDPQCQKPGCCCHTHMVEVLSAARRSLATWLLRIASTLEKPGRHVAGDWAVVCDRVATRLQPFADDNTIEARLATAAGRAGFAAAIDEAARSEADMMTKLADLGAA